MSDSKTISVQYFAALREQAGCSHKEIDTVAQTAEELYCELAKKHSFSLPKEQVKVAINDTFAEPDSPLTHGDRVVFIAPVAGG